MQGREVKQVTQERNVERKTEEEDRAADDPPEGGIRGPQGGPDGAGPRAVGKDQAQVGNDERGETQCGGVRRIEPAPQRRQVDRQDDQQVRSHLVAIPGQEAACRTGMRWSSGAVGSSRRLLPVRLQTRRNRPGRSPVQETGYAPA